MPLHKNLAVAVQPGQELVTSDVGCMMILRVLDPSPGEVDLQYVNVELFGAENAVTAATFTLPALEEAFMRLRAYKRVRAHPNETVSQH